MVGKIYMIKEDGDLLPMNEKKHARELDFQKLIKKYPDLIPGDQIDSENPRRWLFVGEEVYFPTLEGGGLKLDLLFFNQDGIPTLVELKKSDNNELNKRVVAQILEYGANILLSMDTPSLRKRVEENNEFSVIEFLNEDKNNEEEFWEKVYDNLKAEKIRLLVIADEIPYNLQNILEFINRNMESVEILAVEIKQYTIDDIKTLVSRVIGQVAKKVPITNDPNLNLPKFCENLDEIGKEFFGKLFKLSNEEQLKINWGSKGFSLNVPINGKNVSLFQGYSKLSANGQYISSTSYDIENKVKNGDKIREDYVKEIIKVNGFYEVGEGFTYKIVKMLDEENWLSLKKTISKTIEQIRKNGLIE